MRGVSATAARWATTLGSARVRAPVGRDDAWGAITKHGNPRLRRLMVEMAWRVTRFQPGYRGVRRWGPLLENRKASVGARKKAIVALARQLAVDLWRIAIGRVQPQELGLLSKVRRN